MYPIVVPGAQHRGSATAIVTLHATTQCAALTVETVPMVPHLEHDGAAPPVRSIRGATHGVPTLGTPHLR